MKKWGVVLVVLGVGLVLTASAGATTVVTGPCPAYVNDPDVLGCADFEHDTIYVRSAAPTFHRAVLLHEWGHFFDQDYLNASERGKIADRLGWPVWEPEHFADRFAACHMPAVVRHRAFPFAPWGRDSKLCGLLPRLG